jgi:uncharacterized integral membrane protein
MKILSRIIGYALFVVIFGLAIKNTQDAKLDFYFGNEIHLPLVVLLFVTLVAGFALGILAMTPMLMRKRGELNRLTKTIVDMKREDEARQRARTQPPQPDSVANR